MIVLNRETDDIRSALSKAFIDNGFSLNDTIVSNILNAITNVLNKDYADITSIGRNARIDTANDFYLENYHGKFLDEPRSSKSFLIVDDLKTIEVSLVDQNGILIEGNSVTKSGQGIFIERGTNLLVRNEPVMTTLNTVELVSETIFVKAIAIDSNINLITANTIDGIEFDLLSNPDIDSDLLGSAKLIATNRIDISKPVTDVDTETYRFILQEKARSVNLSNEHKLNTLFDNTLIRNFVPKRLNPGSTSMVIYIEVVDENIEDSIIQEVQRQLINIMHYGADIRIRPFFRSTLTANILITLAEGIDDTYREVFKSNFINIINLTESGKTVNIQDLLQSITDQDQNVINSEFLELRINNRVLENPIYTPRDIERINAYNTTITVKV